MSWRTYLDSLERFGVRLGLGPVSALLQAIGTPQAQFPAVHVGGTNGKGSTAAFLDSILRAQGYRVGLYTSPHIHDFSERIQINGRPMPEAEADRIVSEIRERRDRAPSAPPVTFFEFVTAMAFHYFAEQRVDIAVVEVGMGGRLDATNLVNPLVTVITTVSYDHQEYLGHTLAEIAGEKMGILRPGGAAVSGIWQADLRRTLERTCRAARTDLLLDGRDFSHRYRSPAVVDYIGPRLRVRGAKLGLRGRHQGLNASLALASVEKLRAGGVPVSTPSIISGLRDARWPCRMESMGSSPRIVLDGAHNAEGAFALSAALKEEFRWSRLAMVFGVLRDKDYTSMLSWLAPLADSLVFTRPRSDRALDPRDILIHHPRLSSRARVTRSVEEALHAAVEEAGPRGLVVVCGSLFTAAEARGILLGRGLLGRKD